MKLVLDHHYSTKIATALRDMGHDVIAVVERGWDTEADDALLDHCRAEERALLTNNVRDFLALARRWATEGRSHSGMVFTSATALPRGHNKIGVYVTALDELLRSAPGRDAFVDRVHWLITPAARPGARPGDAGDEE